MDLNVVLALIWMVTVTSEEKVCSSIIHAPLTHSLSLSLGFLSRLERKTHIDFNGDNIIGRLPDVYYGGYPSMYGGYPPMFGGYGPMYGGYGYHGVPYGPFF